MQKPTLAVLISLLAAPTIFAASSYYTRRLDDPKAVSVQGNDSDAIQQAVDKVQSTMGEGVVLVPPGRYRITRTVNVWPGIRLIGYGAERPVFVLPDNTPGYQDPVQENYLVFFSGGRGRGGGRPQDSNAGTFYSAMSNIDIEIGAGNAGAVGVRGRYAQHCFLAHMEFRIGSGLAGVHDTGNVMEDVVFRGGQYGIWTQTPSPGWQFTAVDAEFEGQKTAAIRDHAAGLTLIRPHFRNVPAAISIDPESHDQLWVKDGRFEDISGAALEVGVEDNPRVELNLEDTVCRHVPVFARFRVSGRKFVAPAEMYRVRTFSHGLQFVDAGAIPETRTQFDAVLLPAMPPAVVSDLPPLPPAGTWVNIQTLGAKGDGATDDTDVFRKAIAANRTIYIPMGKYILSDTLVLRPDTVLIGLHPSATELVLRDSTAAFAGVGAPKPMLEAPKGGTNIVIGIGLYTNGINPRAVAAKWMAGTSSLMNDVRFLGGHGTPRLDGGRENPYNNTHTADPDLNRRWDGQYPSLWVTDGGGGTFFDIWTPSTFAQSGMLVSDTTTEGRVYEMSSEHHVRNEIQLRRVANWSIYALQTEEERGEGGLALPLEIENSKNITIANLTCYRVTSMVQPFPYAVKVTGSNDIRFRNLHCYSNNKVSFDATVVDPSHDVKVWQREFAWLTLTDKAPAARPKMASQLLTPGATVEKLAGGFFNISGGAVDPAGDFYFVDAHWQRIYRWSVASRQLSTVRDEPLDPVNLAFDKAGNLMVVSSAGAGTVYTFRPGEPQGEVRLLKPEPLAPRPGMTALLPTGNFRVNQAALVQPVKQYLSSDGSTFLPAAQDFVTGALNWGVKASALIRAFGLAQGTAGKLVYTTGESEVSTYVGTLAPDGSVTGLRAFVNQGGESATVDAKGNVYIAAGAIWVYDAEGRLIETIDVPERPTQVVFGGPDGKTMFICARTSLYAVKMR